MSDKVKPWHNRKPKHGNKDQKRKRVVPLRPGNERVSPLQIDEEKLEEYDPADYSERWES